MACLSFSACGGTPDHAASPQMEDGRFRNVVEATPPGFLKTVAITWRFMFDKPRDTAPPAPVPVQALTTAQLMAAPDGSLYRLGHSTLLMKLNGAFWLTDPVFSERASPVQWAGPKRFHAPPIGMDDLPPIEGVILSHDHYDHLDYAAVLALAPKVKHFITPLGVGDRLVEWGVDKAKVQQLDWWQSTEVSGVRLVAAPAQHFSGRTLSDRNRTLWASWVILSGDLRLFFSGDTGYHADFKTIGERYGPFDVTMVETGAYDAQWPDVHMQPEETLQAHRDLKGRTLLPIHNGTFDLALHAWNDPFDRIVQLADAGGVPVVTPVMGERVALAQPQATGRWWRALSAAAAAAAAAEYTRLASGTFQMHGRKGGFVVNTLFDCCGSTGGVMPACYRVDIAEVHLYFDQDRGRCSAPGSRMGGLPNTIYFLRTLAPFPLLNPDWDEGLKKFSADERRCGVEWTKDAAYENPP